MKLLIDTNVLLDVLTRREPFYQDSSKVWEYIESGRAEGHVSAISFNNVYYIVRRLGHRRKANRAVKLLSQLFQVAAVDADTLDRAIASSMRDFEDAIQWACAVQIDANQIITRNTKDYPAANPVAVSPTEFLDTVSGD
jgi:predicted nucleic acid-binding protein